MEKAIIPASLKGFELFKSDAFRKEIRRSKLYNQFIVDFIQVACGTSTKLSANEVIATRAPEIFISNGRLVSVLAEKVLK